MATDFCLTPLNSTACNLNRIWYLICSHLVGPFFYLCLFSVFNHRLAMIWLLQQSRECHMASQHSGTRSLQQ